MDKKIKLLVEKYQLREKMLAERIVELNKIKIKTPREIQELDLSSTLRVFWSVVIQDLKKIADKP